MGRQHKTTNGHYTDRIIDIDILLYGNFTIDTPDLKIPHPLILKRPFVYEPLQEIAPDIITAGKNELNLDSLAPLL